MKPMDEQFADILKPRLSLVQKKVGGAAVQLIARQMKQNVDASKGFSNDPYDSVYSKSHRLERKKRGYPKGGVILKMGRRRINQTKIETTGQGARVSFVEGGDIFRYHHEGTAKGDKTRSIFPKSPQSIPDDIKSDIVQKVQEVLSGQK